MPALKTLPYTDAAATVPSPRLLAITPADSDLTHVCRMRDLFCTTVTHINVASGTYLGPFTIDRVLATGTTATGIVGYV